jgi:3-phenylpropionate/trans-cinnamate dioxygenase ferredoxin reductase component
VRLVIVGGGPAALAAARGYRDAGGDGDVTMLTRELALPYMRPALSKEYLRDEVDEASLTLEPPEWYADHGIEVRLGVTMAAVGDVVELRDGTAIPFDVCVLATGARPRRLFDGPRTLRSLADARELAKLRGRATVIGSGFIGCEAAASLAIKGLDVTLMTDEDVPHQFLVDDRHPHAQVRRVGRRLRRGAHGRARARRLHRLVRA